jgi:hypothetical protein
LKRYRGGPKVGSVGSETDGGRAWLVIYCCQLWICVSKKPETVYAEVDERFHEQLWQSILNKMTVAQVAKQLKFNIRQLYRWKEREILYPLSSLQAICKLVGLKPAITSIRTKQGTVPLYEPKVEQQITPELSEFFGHLLHDGGIDKGYGVHYTTDDKEMQHRFQQLVGICFGRTEVRQKPSGLATVIYYPAILGRLLVRNYGLPAGNKVISNVQLPPKIKRALTSAGLIVPYIAAAYYCDGDHVRDIRIGLASRSLERPSSLLVDFKDLLERLSFRSSRITGSTIYETQDGLHRNWVLRLIDPAEKRRFKQMIEDYRSASIC